MGTFVKYTEYPGIVSERIVTKGDLQAAGIEAKDDIVFNRKNRYMQDASEWPEAAVEFFKETTGFTVSESSTAPRLMTGEKHGADTESVAEPEPPTSTDATATTTTGGSTTGDAGSTASTARRGRA